ncbi:MAG: D-glycero-beta-D-manno-heptose-7-phosphate kinase [Alphaproteobacteria bacterium]|nr:D-glycero-beta-D-manno-heptose-7-phosphate kinase [Alphaproteobacteria bacterium]
MTDISSLIGQMSDARILCVGDLMLDRFVTGTVDRVSPEAPIPVLNVKDEAAMIGGAGNVVRNLVAFGAAAELVAVVGDDTAGDELETLLDATRGVVARLARVKGRRTTIKTRFVTGGQQLLRADHETVVPLSAADRAALLERASDALAECGGLVLSDYGKGVLEDTLIAELIALARDAGKPVIVDPKGDDYSVYRGATLVTPNRNELRQASGMPVDDDDMVVAACRQIIASCGVDGVLATRSEQGMTLVQGDAVHHLPARAREVFDVSGAGDTVAAALAAALALGAPTPDAARLANTAAGVAVGKVGTAAAYASEILTAQHEAEFMTGEAKIATLASARDRVEAWRRQGRRIGFTNGCFDLVHPGHISMLNQARAACDVLIVGLNSDASVRRLKGPERPAQPELGRAAVLASLMPVDMVVIFAEDTPLDLITALRPDILVKGQDYALDEVVGAAEVQSWGGKVVLADILDGHSTTETLRRIAQ